MTDTEAAAPAAEEAAPEVAVPFMGREIWTRVPRPEQLLVWQRTVDRLTKAPANTSWTGSEVMAALERLRQIIDSILVNRIDIDWLDDRFLDGTVGFKELAPFLTDVTNAFAEATGNRETRRTAAKAKKATRKKADR